MVIIDKEKIKYFINKNKIKWKYKKDIKIGDRIIIFEDSTYFNTIFKIKNIISLYNYNHYGEQYPECYECFGLPKFKNFSNNAHIIDGAYVIIDKNIKDEDLIIDNMEEIFFNIFYNDEYVGKTFGIILPKDFDINKITIKKKD